MMTTVKKNRNSNLELLRIILMLVIVLHHYIVNSGITNSVNSLIPKEIHRLSLWCGEGFYTDSN